MKKIYYNILILALLASVQNIFAQQVIGSFPNMDGGYESQTAGNLGNALSNTAWSTSTTTGTASITSTGGRSGPKYATLAYSSASTKRFQSQSTDSLLGQATVRRSTRYTIQFYYKTSGATGPTNMRIGIGTNGTSSNAYKNITLSGTSGVWTKFATDTVSSGTQGTVGMGMLQANGTMGSVSIDVDDFVMYAGSPDASAPDAPTSPVIGTTTSAAIPVSWTAPGTGVDGGGYVVVRYNVSPDVADVPNSNGIYALSNTFTKTNTGTVRYIGTGTSFTDNVGLSPSTTYYYRIFTVDKAFNYSSALDCNGTTAAPSYATEPTQQPTGLGFSSVTQTGMTISWTKGGDATNTLVVVKAASAVAGTPSDGATYNAQSAYGTGDVLGAGEYIVYNGTGTSVSVTGLTKLTKYYVALMSFNGSGSSENYFISSPLTGNQTTIPGEVVSAGTSSAGVTWNTPSAWVGGVVPTASDNVTVVSPDKFAISTSQSCYNLTVDAGAKVYNNTALPTSSIQYLTVFGTSMVINGKLGDKILDESTDGALGINVNNNLTISGTGTIRPARIRSNTNAQNITITFDADVQLSYTGSTGTGGSGLYSDVSGNDNITFKVNAGKTLSGVSNCNFATSGTTSNDGTASTTFIIDGTLSMPGGLFGLRIASGKTCSVTVNNGGLLSIGKDLLPTGTTGQTSTITVNAGGELRMTGSGRVLDLAAPAQTITGAGTLTLGSGVTVNIGADAGLDPVNGQIKTTTRSFATDAIYAYVGTAAQVTGSDLPATVGGLTVNNSAGLSLTNNVLVNGTLGLTLGNITTGSKTIDLGTTGAITGETTGKYVIGNLNIQRTVGASAGSPQTFGGIGVTLADATDDLGVVSVSRTTGTAVDIGGSNGIKRKWSISSANAPVDSRNLTFSWVSDDDNGKTLTNMQVWKSTDGGSTWAKFAEGLDGSTRSVTVATNSFSDWTVTDDSSPLPVTLKSISAQLIQRGVIIKWETATEVNSNRFEVERGLTSGKAGSSTVYEKIGLIQAHGNKNSLTSYSFTDQNLNTGKYTYRLKMIDNDGTFEYSVPVSIEIGKPNMTDIKQNYPNSFNPQTKIEYQLANPSTVKIELYNMAGQYISTLVNDEANAGYYVLMVDANKINNGLSSGMYLYRMTALDKVTGQHFSATKKMLFVK